MLKKIRMFFMLHFMLMIYSMSGIFSKKAAAEQFLSIQFCLYYGTIIILLGVYAIGWQQIIKKLPLATAYANKAITVVWGLIWGSLFFGETITVGKMIGVILVILGIVLYVILDDKENENE